jgi:hypothetical protein
MKYSKLMFIYSLQLLLNIVNSSASSCFKIEFSSIDSAKQSIAFYSLHVSCTFEIISLYAVLKNVKNLKGKYFLKLNHPISPLFQEFEWNEP